MEIKKDLQKTIKAFRAEHSQDEYPKAMLTARQAINGTATVNCGNGRKSINTTHEIANRVLADEGFKAFLARHNATACIETEGCYHTKQIRISY